MLLITLAILNIFFVILIIFISKFAYKMAKIVMAVEDALEESLDILDKRHESLTKILEIPIFFDSHEVRQAVDDIEVSRNAILYVANIMTQSIDKNAVEDIEQDEGENNAR